MDETSFQQLLAAAYVVQQHNESLRARQGRLETSRVLAEIAEIQSLARADNLDVPGVARLVADRLRKMTEAAGVSVSLVTDGFLDCAAESGAPANIPGSSVASHSLVATERLKSDEVFESDDAQNDIRLDTNLCSELKTGALVAAPIARFGELSGLIEIRWERAKGFQEGDTRACRLMAGLMGSVLEHGEYNTAAAAAASTEATAANPVAAEHNADDALRNAKTTSEVRAAVAGPAAPDAADVVERCRVCGKPFAPDEVFCGQCSMPRVAGAPAEGMQSKWASLWYMQQAQAATPQRGPETRAQWPRFSLSAEPPRFSSKPESPKFSPSIKESAVSAQPVPEPTRSLWTTPRNTAAAPSGAAVATASESSYDPFGDEADGVMARVSHSVGRWGRQTILVAVSSVVIFLVLSVAWALSPAPGNGQITRFESVLVELGLAEVPSKPAVAVGRAEVQVWVDVHTALYYCEGSDLYGKTPEGRFTTQGEAQQDQFEPATKTPCP